MSEKQDVIKLRQQFKETRLVQAEMPDDPAVMFDFWFGQAQEAELPQPNGMSIATVSTDGTVSSRLVILRYFDEGGFVFFSSYETQKAKDITENEKVALLFPWLLLERQVRVQGTAMRIPTPESLRFFASRSRERQLGAWLTQSSDVISSRGLLRAKWVELKQKFQDGRIPLPTGWGGYRVRPSRFEFWQGHEDGLHDRIVYTRQEDDRWQIERLRP